MNEEKKNQRIEFKVHDMPMELVHKYISLAKLHYDNQVWRVLEHGMKLLMGEEKSWKEEVEARLLAIENQLEEMKKRKKRFEAKERPEVPITEYV